MTSRVFVHGNPETSAVWGPLLEVLRAPPPGSQTPHGQKLTCLSPPGFGAPLPEGFGTMQDYHGWLVAELEAFEEPVDLVGHDWGGAHVVGVAMTRPDLLRSWVTDAIGIFDPGYVWHDLAHIWQTPGEGERDIAERFGGAVQARAAAMTDRGIEAGVAQQLALGQGEQMGQAVLRLYRSATQPAMANAGRDLPRAAARPGLCLLATNDALVGSDTARRRCADQAGAEVTELPGLGHWWMVQDPSQTAQALDAFWANLETRCE